VTTIKILFVELIYTVENYFIVIATI